jgi:DNA repair protein RadC
MTTFSLREATMGDETLAYCPRCSAPLTGPTLTGTRFRQPNDIFHAMSWMGQLEREELHVVVADVKNRIVATERVYQGSVSASLVRIGELFTEAVRRHASGIVIVHNHPSGDPTPSPDDLHLTAQAIAAGRLLDIAVLDHIIIGRDAYRSLRDDGVSFDRPLPTAEPMV